MAVTYESIATTTLGSNSASVTFSSISGSYTDLILIMLAKTTDINSSAYIKLRFNNDTGTNYSVTRIYGNGSTASSDRFSNANEIDSGYLPGANGTGFGTSFTQIMNYANTTTYKTALGRWGSEAGASGSRYTAATVGLWRSTSAITRIDLSFQSGDIASGSTFTLYGVKASA